MSSTTPPGKDPSIQEQQSTPDQMSEALKEEQLFQVLSARRAARAGNPQALDQESVTNLLDSFRQSRWDEPDPDTANLANRGSRVAARAVRTGSFATPVSELRQRRTSSHEEHLNVAGPPPSSPPVPNNAAVDWDLMAMLNSQTGTNLSLIHI